MGLLRVAKFYFCWKDFSISSVCLSVSVYNNNGINTPSMHSKQLQNVREIL